MKVKKGDLVKMIAGKDKGKTGKVLRVILEKKKAVIDGLNLVKKHKRPRKEGEKGQRVEIPRAVDASNLILVCSKCGKASRAGYKKSGDKKIRFCKKCKAEM